MTARQSALIGARVAGYHGDSRTFTRLLVEARVRRELMNAEWQRGADMRKAGIPCGCHGCQRALAA